MLFVLDEKLPEIWNEFVNAGRVDGVCSLYAKDARLLATFAAVPVDDEAGIRAYFEGFTSRPGAGVSFDEHGSRRQEVGDQIFLYTGTYTFFMVRQSKRQRFPARYSFLVDEARWGQNSAPSFLPDSRLETKNTLSIKLTNNMLSPKQTLDTYYLEARRDLLEVAALLDRYDEAVKTLQGDRLMMRRLVVLREAMEILASPRSSEFRSDELLLEHFSSIS